MRRRRDASLNAFASTTFTVMPRGVATTPAPSATTAEPEASGGASIGYRLAAIALALTLLPLVVSAVAIGVKSGTGYLAQADIGLIELQTGDVGRRAVLLGLYSRDGWNHPGPALFYALALPYRLAGNHSIGLVFGALLINGSAVAGMALIARRRGGLPLMLITLTGCAVLMRALGPAFLRDPWNPYITVLPFGLLVFLVWAMTCGEAWALPVGVGVASFCIQVHVGYALLAVPLLAWGATWLVVLAVRQRGDPGEQQRRRSRGLLRAAVVAFLVLIVMWLPVAIQQLSNSPGNLTEVLRYFTESKETPHSLGDGYRAVSGQFGPTPEWVTGDLGVTLTGESALLYSARLPVLLVPLGVAIIAFWRWRHSDANRLVATLLLTLALGVLAVTRTLGLAYAYRLRWTWFLGTLALIVVAWAAWMLMSELARRRSWGIRAILALPLSALVILSVVNAVSAARAGTPQAHMSSATHELGSEVEAELPEGRGDVLLLNRGFLGGLHKSGLVRYLERRGIAARVDASSKDAFGAHRVHQPNAPLRATFTVAANDEFDEMFTWPHLRLVAYWGTKPPEERAKAVLRRAALHKTYEAGTISFETLGRREASLHVGSAVGVFTTR
jgi:hypothetical protein